MLYDCVFTGGGNSSGRSSPNEDPAAAKLFVGGLSWQTSPDKLKEYFGMFGTVTDVLIMKDPLTQVLHKTSVCQKYFSNIYVMSK